MAEKVLPQLDPLQRYEINEAAALLRCCRARVYTKIARGELRAIKDGRRTYVPGSEIVRVSALAAAASAVT